MIINDVVLPERAKRSKKSAPPTINLEDILLRRYDIFPTDELMSHIAISLGSAVVAYPFKGKYFAELGDPRFGHTVDEAIRRRRLIKFIVVRGVPTISLDALVEEKYYQYAADLFEEFKGLLRTIYLEFKGGGFDNLNKKLYHYIKAISMAPLKQHFIDSVLEIAKEYPDISFFVRNDINAGLLFKNAEGILINQTHNYLNTTTDTFTLPLSVLLDNLRSHNLPDFEIRREVLENAYGALSTLCPGSSTDVLVIQRDKIEEVKSALRDTKDIYDEHVLKALLASTIILNYFRGPFARELQKERKTVRQEADGVVQHAIQLYNAIKSPNPIDTLTTFGQGDLANNRDGITEVNNALNKGTDLLRVYIDESLRYVNTFTSFEQLFSGSQVLFTLGKGNNPLEESYKEKIMGAAIVMAGAGLTYLLSDLQKQKAESQKCLTLYERLRKSAEQFLPPYKQLTEADYFAVKHPEE